LTQWGEVLARQLGRPVLDKTGITGKYRILVQYEDGKGNGTAPDLVTAVEEQLGLKLESTKAAVEVVVVERADKVPAEN
jgi:uncharacterized protein (TIGR03435 family)